MKKMALGILLIASFISKGQTLTLSAFPGRTFNQTRAASGSLWAMYQSTGGPNIYLSKNVSGNRWEIVTVPGFGMPTLWASSSENNDLEPPCNDVWVQGSSTLIPISITGSNCISLPIDPVGSSVTTSEFGVIFPAHTTNQILTIPNPQVGLSVFDFSLNKIRTWNGIAWVPL